MFKSSIIVTSLSLILSIIGFVSQVLIAKFFGAGQSLDIFLTFSSFPTLVAAVIASALSYSLTPMLIDAKNTYSKQFDRIIGNMLLKIGLVVGILILFVDLLIYFLGLRLHSNIDSLEYEIGVKVLILSSINVMGTIISGFFSSQFNAGKRFVIPLLLNFFPYIFSIFLLILFHKNIGILSIPIGLMTGTFVSVLIAILLLHDQISFEKLPSNINKYVNNFLKGIPIATVAMLCFTIYQTIDAYWASKLGTSNLSYLGYCQRLLIAVGALVITGPSTVLIPRLTQAILEDRIKDFLVDVNLIIKIIFSLASVFAILGSLLSKEIIFIMFQRGAFMEKDTNAVASILPYMLTGMIFMLCVVIMFRMLFVQRRSSFVAILGVLSTILYFIMSGVAVHFSSLQGICVAYILTWLVLFILCLRKIFIGNKDMYINKINFFFLAKQVATLFVVVVVVVMVKLLCLQYILSDDIIGKIIIVTLCSSTGMFSYLFVACNILKLNEIIFLVNGIKSIIKSNKNV